MTSVISPPRGAAGSTAPDVCNVLPLSGCLTVLRGRTDRRTLEVFDPDERLLAVVTSSRLDTSLVRGSWRGERDGQPWALVIGRSSSAPVTVRFALGPLRYRQSLEVAAVADGDFWIAEAAVSASHASIFVTGVAAIKTSLRRL